MTQTRKARILYINHTGQVSGAEKLLLCMLRGLDRDRYEPTVLCPEYGELSRLLKAESIPWQPSPLLHARFTLRPDRLVRYAASLGKAIVTTRKIIQAIDPDFIHANTLRAGIVATLATIGTGRMVIWHVHDRLPRHPVSTGIRLLSYLSRRTRVITVSDATARAFNGHFPHNNRICTIHNGTDLSKFPLKQPGRMTFREEAGIPQDAFLICALGQICARKGLRGLVDAFSQVYARAPHIHLAIVGRVVFAHEEEYLHSLMRTVTTSRIADRVHFTGERSDVSAVLQGADLLVLNSLDEPFGLVLIEAMSSGTPVLATRVGGIPEIVKDSENGWLIESGDTATLASRMLELSQNRAMVKRVADVAHDITCPQFSLLRFQSKLHAYYAELESQRRVPRRVQKQIALPGFGVDGGDNSHA